eukprot:1328755-Rhodomonas_salina.5
MSGTDLSAAAVYLLFVFAMPGADTALAVTHSLRNRCTASAMRVRVCYAMSGTDVIFNGEELGKAWSEFQRRGTDVRRAELGLQTAVEKGKPNFGGSQAPEADGMSFWEYLAGTVMFRNKPPTRV